ncbi:MAG TPA: YdcF family protein [Steroidobacteraceae bacterium]|nr:YdcF family protein [Steroidobacteraceae bacterium]
MDADLAVRAVCRALVLPPGGPLLLGCAGLALLGRAPRAGRVLIALGLGSLLLLSLPLVGDSLIRLAQRYPPLDLGRPPSADVIVVLAGGVRRNATGEQSAVVQGETLERLAYAARLARRTGLPLLLSGGSVEPGESEARIMQQTLRADFALDARWLETGSRTTRENARQTAALLAPLGLKHVLLVTSAIHMRRAVGEFAATGLDIVPAPVAGTGEIGHGLLAWLPSADGLEHSHEALYELAGELVARLDGGR